jgi:predicted transcriptional regulator of viral defense system
VPYNNMKRQATNAFFINNPVFSLDLATEALSPPGGKTGTVERLKYHLEKGRLKLVAREIYAVIPPGISAEQFQPDPFLVAIAVRPKGTFAYHSALELLGISHSYWSMCTLYAAKIRRPISLNGTTVKFMKHPKAFRSIGECNLGTRKVERLGKVLSCTGPERTLVEGFNRPELAGGLEEFLVSASGFPVLNLALLEKILQVYDIRQLWASVGWFLERFQQTFHVSEETLERMECNRPKSPQYLIRSRRGGVLQSRWNLILPDEIEGFGESNVP